MPGFALRQPADLSRGIPWRVHFNSQRGVPLCRLSRKYWRNGEGLAKFAVRERLWWPKGCALWKQQLSKIVTKFHFCSGCSWRIFGQEPMVFEMMCRTIIGGECVTDWLSLRENCDTWMKCAQEMFNHYRRLVYVLLGHAYCNAITCDASRWSLK